MSGRDPQSEQPLVSSRDSVDEHLFLPEKAQRRTGISRFLGGFGFTLLLVLVIAISFLAGTRMPTYSASLDRECAQYTTQWSPILEETPIRYAKHNFNGSFMAENIYRLPGSDDVDKAWEDLGVGYRAGVVSYEQGLASGLDKSYVQRAPKYGGGFLVNVEGMHHLHCLNLLRKSLYFNYDRYKKLGEHAFMNEDFIVRLHVTHCLDTIRQVLMCNVDTGLLGQVWVYPDEPMAFPVFNTQHVCKNYDDVREWARKLQAPPLGQTPRDYLELPDEHSILADIP